MIAAELKSLLAGIPDDMVVAVDTDGSSRSVSEMRCAKRDILSDSGELKQTIFQIRHDNYGKDIGHKHLDDVERERQEGRILSEIGNAGYRFMINGTAPLIYRDTGSSQDHCYGTYYDPRVFKKLVEDGKIEISGSGLNAHCWLIKGAKA